MAEVRVYACGAAAELPFAVRMLLEKLTGVSVKRHAERGVPKPSSGFRQSLLA